MDKPKAKRGRGRIAPRELEILLERARDRLERYESAIRAVEEMLGKAADELGFDPAGEMLDYSAEALMAMARKGKGRSDD